MAKNSRLKQDYRTNASKLHKAIGDMLHASPLFSNYRIYQEYPVNRISPYFDSGKEKFDWIILDLMIVIECHGQQHYEPVCFGGMSEEEAQVNYQNQVFRDLKKKKAAEKAGWTYVVFRYDEKEITSQVLMEKVALVQEGLNTTSTFKEVSTQIRQKNKPKIDPDYHKEQLEKARQYRKKQYQRYKDVKKNNR